MIYRVNINRELLWIVVAVYSMYSCAEDPLYHPVVIKEKQRYWKRILIVDDNADLTLTFEEVIEDSNNNNDANKRIEVHTSNDPVVALSEFKISMYTNNLQ